MTIEIDQRRKPSWSEVFLKTERCQQFLFLHSTPLLTMPTGTK
jgi:hypothetical protein